MLNYSVAELRFNKKSEFYEEKFILSCYGITML